MLTRGEVEALAELPESEAAEKLLTGVMGPMLRMGIEPFGVVTARVAYLVHRAYRMARNPNGDGVLKGKPGYETMSMLRHRVESAAECSAGLSDFARQLFDRLGLSLAQLRTSDALWWRGVCSHAPDGAWLNASSPSGLVDLLSASMMLDDFLREIRKSKEAA